MPAFIRKHTATFLIAFVTATVAGGSFVWAHNAPSNGHVKFAHKAGTAKKVTGVKVLPLKRVSPSATNVSREAARDDADKIVLYSKGPLKVYAKCFFENSDPDNPGVHGDVYLQTDRGGTIYASYQGDTSNRFVGPSTPEDFREILDESSYAGTLSPGTTNVSRSEDGNFYAAVGNSQMTGQIFVGTKVGSPAIGDGVFGAGNRCIFGGTITAR